MRSNSVQWPDWLERVPAILLNLQEAADSQLRTMAKISALKLQD